MRSRPGRTGQASDARIDAREQLALVESQADRVIGLPRARFPRRFLSRKDRGKPIEIGDHASIDRLIDGEQSA
jgi:hypothetical protein